MRMIPYSALLLLALALLPAGCSKSRPSKSGQPIPLPTSEPSAPLHISATAAPPPPRASQ